MGRSPLGVAIGVSGEAQIHCGAQPKGHVPAALGAVQAGSRSIGPCGSQQIAPAPQQELPQQVVPD